MNKLMRWAATAAYGAALLAGAENAGGQTPEQQKQWAEERERSNQAAQARASMEAALLERFRFTLVTMETPPQRFKITRVSNLIGRNPACDISINHGSISRQHRPRPR